MTATITWRGGRRLLLAAALAGLAATAAAAPVITPLRVTTADGVRTGLVARSSRAPHASGRPLVLLLHGHMGSAAQVFGRGAGASPLSVWLEIAERETLVVAALDGSDAGDGQRGWNDCRVDAPGNPPTDDVAFARAAIAEMRRSDAIDPARVYAMGMSNGGMMTFRLALELEPPLAAFAAVSAGMADGGSCGAPTRPIPALLVDGTDDPLVPWAGGQVHFYRKQRGAVIGAEQAAAAWRVACGLANAAPVTITFPHTERGNPTRATRTVWGDTGGPQVELVRIDGGGHVEPSESQRVRRVYELVVGRQNHDLEVAEEAWRFFRDRRAPRH